MGPHMYTGAEARALADAATPGPWVTEHDDDAAEGDGASPLTIVYGETRGLGARAVAEVRGGRPEDIADAALVAAAPDLAYTVDQQAATIADQGREIAALRERVDALVQRAETVEQAGAKAAQERDEARVRLETARAYVASLDHAEGCASEVDGDDAPCDCSVGTMEALLSAPVPDDVRALADARASVVMMREVVHDHRAALSAAKQARDAALAHAEELTRALTTLRAAVREWAAAHAAWDAWPNGKETALGVHIRAERADDALRALANAPKAGAL